MKARICVHGIGKPSICSVEVEGDGVDFPPVKLSLNQAAAVSELVDALVPLGSVTLEKEEQ